MRKMLVLLIVGFLNAASRADSIRYDRIPSDAVSYIFGDVDALMKGRLAQINALESRNGAEALLGTFGNPHSITLYSFANGDTVLLLDGWTKKFQQDVEANRSKDTVVVEYEHQQIHCSTSCLLPEVFGSPIKKEVPARDTGSHLYIGLGASDDYRRHWDGSFYTAYVGADLTVATTNLHTICDALDVLNGRKPSLAKEDSRSLKMDAPPGMMMMGAGLSAESSAADFGTGATNSGGAGGSKGGGLDLLGSMRIKISLARCVVGENDREEYADVMVTMVDSDSAQQFKNLLLGLKAMVDLSQAPRKALIDPLDVQSAGNEVKLHWTWPTAKLSELVRLIAEPPNNDGSKPSNIPATQPAN